jgi:enoyl-[acyl-carrier protein] reductase I
MIPIDLSGKVALVTGVANDLSFAWFIAKALQAAGARLVFSCHPRMIRMVEGALTSDRPDEVNNRQLPYGAGSLKPEKVLPCDVSFDTMADVPEETRQGMMDRIKESHGGIDILVHSIAFSPEIKNKAVETSRAAYLTALGVSAYSLTALLRAGQPLMENRKDGASAVALSYLGGDRVVPHYGGGMSTAKAALQIDAKQLASNLGPKNIRVNVISAGPYKSLAAGAIGDMDRMIAYAAERSPLPRGIKPEEVANAAVFLCSPLASAITGHVLYVDCGYHVMGV